MRIILDPFLDGPTNMARDEALLQNVSSDQAPATLRLYGWSEPTISLGYFQHFSDYERLPHPAGSLPVVRRPTGGGAILHDLELTYSVALPLGHELLSGGATKLYGRAHDAVIATLASLGLAGRQCGVTDDSGAARGPFFCFARRHCYDVLLDTEKIAGSAQRRTRHGVLQHGSIMLGNRFAQHPAAAAFAAERFLALHEQVRTTFIGLFCRETGLAGEIASWREFELRTALRLREKYAGVAWTQRR